MPQVMVRREFIFDTLRAAFRKFGFAPIETPSMEKLEVLSGKYGEEGDRLIFRILNSGDYFSGFASDEEMIEAKNKGLGGFTRKIAEKALRYDLTVPFARAVVMHQNDLTFPFRRYQIQPVWRADRPQKGRYREFYQCDADIVGSDSLILDAELVALLQEAFDNLGLPEVTVSLNNRKILTGIADAIGRPEKFNSMCVAIDKLDKAGKDSVGEELQRNGLTADEVAKLFELLAVEGNDGEKLNKLREAFAGSEVGLKGVAEMEEVLSYLPAMNVRGEIYKFDVSLARGLDYYTGTIYEVKSNEVSIGSIAGGGRYDDLTGVFGRPGLPGTGISFGADRIYDVMNELDRFPESATMSTKVMIANFGGDSVQPALKMLAELRDAGIAAIYYPDAAKLGKQFKYADATKIPLVILAGSEELNAGKVNLKDLASGEQESVAINDIVSSIKQKI